MKQFSMIFLAFMVIAISGCAQPKEIQLPDPIITGGMPLMDALKNRKSAREFSDKNIDNQTLSNLLWAAFGYNRIDEKKRTAPSANNKQEIEIYCAMRNGLFLWNPDRNVLIPIVEEDVRAKTGGQDYVAAAALNLIYVCNNDVYGGGMSDSRKNIVYVDTGYISENVYLFCASTGLSTVARGFFDPVELSKTLSLPDSKWVVLTQSIGYPK
ncbi:MAG: SagB/ThcOx family dehydrogenase [Bacteroidales bacterium]|jgi:nitroreductase|nr:SagB/ThcOx family dehydrogenase [Bacteroidales bacterium]